METAEKEVVEEVSWWLRVYGDGTVDRSWTGPPEFEFLVSPHHPSPEKALLQDGVVLHDLNVPPPFGVTLRVYVPSSAEENTKLPLLLHFQGGGFCISRPTWYMYYQFYSRVATACDAVVVSVTTRLAPTHRLPAAIDDAYAALLWLRALARSDGQATEVDLAGLQGKVDFSRVFLIGDSSGGNLVHQVAARAGRDEAERAGFWSPLKVAGGIPIHPGFVRSYRSRSELEGKPDAFLSLEMLDKFLALALPAGSTKDHPITCPMGDAAPAMEGLTLPPMMVSVAENDLIRDTEMEYCDAMKRAGKEVEVFHSSNVGHSFYLNKIAVDHDPTVANATKELIDAIRGFIRRH